MKQTLGNKKLVVGIFLIIAILIAIIVRLNWRYEYFDEATVLKYYIERFSEPEKTEILVFDKYIVSDEYTYYYTKVSYPPISETESYELLLILNHSSRIVDMVHLNDMEAGYYDEIKSVWDNVKQKEPDVSFTQEIIDEITEVVLTK